MPDQHPEPRLDLARTAADTADVDEWSELFSALSDPNRLRILLAIHRAPGINVSELAAATGMTDNATSHALNSLRIRGLVQANRSGRERQWNLCHDAVHELLHRVGATHSPLHPEHEHPHAHEHSHGDSEEHSHSHSEPHEHVHSHSDSEEHQHSHGEPHKHDHVPLH